MNLDDMENMAGITSQAGETPPEDVQATEAVDVVQEQAAGSVPAPGVTPDQSVTTPEHAELVAAIKRASALDIALLKKSESEQVAILKSVVARGLDKDDPIIDIYNAAVASAKAAKTTASAALSVNGSFAAIPARVLEGALKAGADVAGRLDTTARTFEKRVLEVGDAVTKSIQSTSEDSLKGITDASNAGAEKIRTAALTLTDSLDKAVQAKADEGAKKWAEHAAKAGQDAARGALGKATHNAAIAMFLLFILGVCAGAFGLEMVRDFDGDYLPAGLRIYQAPGGDTLRVDPRVMLMQNAGLCGHDVCVPLVKNVQQPGQPAKP